MKVILGLVVIYAALLGASYVPAFVSVTPGMLTPGTTVEHVEYASDISSKDLDAAAKHGCHQIPFWMRPVANFPRHTRLVVDRAGTEIGSLLVRCSDYKVVDSTGPAFGPSVG